MSALQPSADVASDPKREPRKRHGGGQPLHNRRDVGGDMDAFAYLSILLSFVLALALMHVVSRVGELVAATAERVRFSGNCEVCWC